MSDSESIQVKQVPIHWVEVKLQIIYLKGRHLQYLLQETDFTSLLLHVPKDAAPSLVNEVNFVRAFLILEKTMTLRREFRC